MKHIIILLTIISLLRCQGKYSNMEQGTYVEIETSAGTVTLKLYDDIPLHRDNFIKMVEEGAYNGCLFHRVIKGVMAQTGNTKIRIKNDSISTNNTEYTHLIPAEIKCPKYFHKRGALASARKSDYQNPEKLSSGTDFYIVTGEVHTLGSLIEQQTTIYMDRVDSLYEKLRQSKIKELYLLRKSGQKKEHEALQDSIRAKAEEAIAKNPQMLTDYQKKLYTTIGGVPHLDYEYTVFGEVIEGMEAIDKIEKTSTQKNRPVKDFYIKSAKVIRIQ